jgi:CBS domain-containing protein
MKYLSLSLLSALPLLTSSFSVNRVFVGTPLKTDARLVEDCMSPNPVTLLPSNTVDEAIQELLKLGFNGAPVVDPETKRLVGVVSAFDFLQKEEGGALLPMQGTPQELEAVIQSARKICATTVGDLMTPVAITITPTTTMRDAAGVMIKNRLHRLCVVDEQNELIGVLATSDVMKDVLTTVRKGLPEPMEADEVDGGNNNLSP